MRPSRAGIAKAFGWVIGLAGLLFVGRLVLREWETISTLVRDGNPAWFVAALLAGIVGLSGIGVTWGVMLRDLDRAMTLPQTLRGYFVGQLGKYVPGGVWAIMGRGEWAATTGVSRRAAYVSTVLSMVTAYLGASTVVLVQLALGVRPSGYVLLAVGVAALSPAGVIALHPRVFTLLLRLLERLRRSQGVAMTAPSWGRSIGYLMRQVPSWLLIGFATYAVARALNVPVDPLVLLLATCVSWVAGFLFLPTPGGIGIREAAFVGVLGGDAVVAGVALAARVVFVLADAIGAGLSSVAVARAGRR